jgi:hypothetical protein
VNASAGRHPPDYPKSSTAPKVPASGGQANYRYAEVTLVTGITFLTSAAEILKGRLLGGLKASPVGIRFAVWTAVPTTIAAAIVSRSGNRI